MRTLEARPNISARNPLDTYDVVKEAEQIVEKVRIPKWSSFGQLMIVQELDGPNGGKVKKIAAIDLAYPLGVNEVVGEGILRNTLEDFTSDIASWNGVKEGKLLALSKEIPSGEIDLGIIDRFVSVSARAIGEKLDGNEESVRDYFDLEKERVPMVDGVKDDARRVSEDSSFLRTPALNEKYKGKGIIFLEYYMDEKGDVWGVSPAGNDALLEKLAADDPHAQSLRFMVEQIRKPGSRIIGHFENTETVKTCRGSDGCSAFFDLMDRKDEKTIFNKDKYEDVMLMPGLASASFGKPKWSENNNDKDDKSCDSCGAKAHQGKCPATEEQASSE